jgi:hypothetical protein
VAVAEVEEDEDDVVQCFLSATRSGGAGGSTAGAGAGVGASRGKGRRGQGQKCSVMCCYFNQNKYDEPI